MSQAGIQNFTSASGVTNSVTGNDGITANPTTGNVQLFLRGSGTRNTFLGQGAGVASPGVTAVDNTSLGFNALHSLTDGLGNTAIGSGALDTITTPNNNTAVGFSSLTSATTAAGNTAIGKSALSSLLTGSNNVCLGASAGGVYTGSESNNLCLGANTGVLGDSLVIRIGSIQTTCFVQGIASVAVTGESVVIDTTTGQLGSTLSPSVQRPIVTVSGTSKTFGLSDANTFQLCTNGSTVTLTVPANGTIAFPVGTEIDVFQQGAGQVVFAAAGGVTIQSVFSNLKIANQFTGASLKKIGSDTWCLLGNLTA